MDRGSETGASRVASPAGPVSSGRAERPRIERGARGEGGASKEGRTMQGRRGRW